MRPGESFVNQPIRSLQTMLRVIAESDSSYQSLVPDGIYGSDTSDAVAQFQRNHGLPVTGITDQSTWEHIAARYRDARTDTVPAEEIGIIFNPGQPIRRGERNHNLHLVQAMLAVLSEVYLSVSEPSCAGVLDIATESSVASFQALSGLPVTGEVDKVTWKHLALHFPLASNLKLKNE